MGRRTPVHIEVIVYDQSQVEKMIKKFSRKVKKSGLFEELRERKFYTKKSVKNSLKRKNKKRLSQLLTEKYKQKHKNANN